MTVRIPGFRSQEKLRKPTKLSFINLLIVTGIFGAVGGYLLITSFAGSSNPLLQGDINNDGKVDVIDLSSLLSRYGSGDLFADLNNDHTVNIQDLSLLLSNWARTGGTIGLHVVGNKLFDSANKEVVIHGVSKSGTEFGCVQGWGIFEPDGANTPQLVQAIKSWSGINTVRLPLNEDCWLGINGVNPAYSGFNYQNAIKAFVDLLVANNLIVVLDLHWTAPGSTLASGQQPMMDRDHSVTFWTQVATVYKNYGTVIFDLHNEPFPDNNQDTTEAWRCWRDGGTCSGVSYQAAGMQEVVTAVRNTGAANLMILGGVQYANALTQWLAYKPNDPFNNIAPSWHMYGGNLCSSPSCWNQTPASVATQMPLINSEFGEHYDLMHCTNDLVGTFMDWMDAKNASYIAWSWNQWGECLNLVTDVYNGTPTAWGQFYKDHVTNLAH